MPTDARTTPTAANLGAKEAKASEDKAEFDAVLKRIAKPKSASQA